MENLNQHIEHTLLKQDAKKEEFIKLFEEAKENNFLGVCSKPFICKSCKRKLERQ